MKDIAPDPYDVETKKVPVSKESQALQNMYGKNNLSRYVIQSIHDIQARVTALPYNVAAKLENIPYLEFHFISPADMLRNLKINTGLQDCHSELIVSKPHSLCCT